MKIMPPSGAPGKARETRITTRPKALVTTALSLVGALVCLAAYSFDYSYTVQVFALASEGILVVTCALFWRFERLREVRFKSRFPEPLVIHGG
jgi:hypothetical protein